MINDVASKIVPSTKKLGIILLALMVISCGFHLRGSLEIPSELQRIQLRSQVPSHWTRNIKATLTNAGVEFNKTANIILNLEEAQETRQIASYNDNAKAAEYQLMSELTFSVEDKQGTLLIPKRVLVSERIYQYDENLLAGKSEEEALLKQEMQRDLIRQLVQQFRLTIEPDNDEPDTDEPDTDKPETKGSEKNETDLMVKP